VNSEASRVDSAKTTGNVAFVALLFLSVAALLAYHARIVTFPYPLEFREGAMIQTTKALLDGVNPYALHNQPQDTNVYGIFYSLVCYPFAECFGPGLQVHRAVAAIFILLSCLVVFLFARAEGHPLMPSFTASAILYASLLYNQTPLARPDSLGLFLFLVSLYVPYRKNYSWGSLSASIIIGVFAFFTKTFFLLLYPFLGSYLFFFVSKKKGIAYSAFSAVILIISAMTANLVMETYVANVFFNHINIATYDFERMISQLLIGAKAFAFLFILSAYAALSSMPAKVKQMKLFLADTNLFGRLAGFIDVRTLDRRFCMRDLPCTTYYLFCAVLVFILKLGGHGGAWMTYFYHLISPFLLLFFLDSASCLQSPRRYSYFMTAGIANLAFFFLTVLPHYTVHDVESNWEQIGALVAAKGVIYNSPAIAPLLQEQHKRVFDSGHSEYFGRSVLPNEFSCVAACFPSDSRVRGRLKQYRRDILESIKTEKYDMIVLNAGNGMYRKFIARSALTTNYARERTLTASMPHTGQYWLLDFWIRK
jgi:hypothetical protein